jgi:hypothetical protein
MTEVVGLAVAVVVVAQVLLAETHLLNLLLVLEVLVPIVLFQAQLRLTQVVVAVVLILEMLHQSQELED